MKPNITGLNQLDTAVLMQKMIVLNGMLLYGTDEEKQIARVELKSTHPEIISVINLEAIEQAKYELNISNEELSIANKSLTVY
ncbi:hypothetical protein [Cytobacillus praedii]|uniref:hypothetical protein n=1 Tax=Cytobacillus praedii TaxID=1742358 RepID=UPI002E205F60|nr:hypothetical protein [Cytobacillus praedii]